MVGNALNVQARGSQPIACGMHFVERVHLERDMVDPRRRIGGWLGRDVVAEIEEGQIRPIAHLEKDMHKRAMFAHARHCFRLHQMHKRQAEQILVEGPGFLRIAASIRKMAAACECCLGLDRLP